MDDFTCVACQCAKKASIPIHDNKSKTGIVFEEFTQCLCVEFIVAEVEGCVDWLEGLKIDVEFALLAFVGDDITIISLLSEKDYPQNTTRPFGGTRLYNFNRC